jgi:hypothetical protein
MKRKSTRQPVTSPAPQGRREIARERSAPAPYVRVRFIDKTELCWTLQTAHVLRESDLSDWKTGDCKQLKVYAENEIDWPD